MYLSHSMMWGCMYRSAHTFCIDTVALGTSFGNRNVECGIAFIPEMSSFLDHLYCHIVPCCVTAII
jgi:hypothetical protein